jgi:hypothetical protein
MRRIAGRDKGAGRGVDVAARFSVKVLPRASRNALVDCREGTYRLHLTAPPVEGRGNEALRSFLADGLGVPKTAVRIVSGERSRTKTVEILGRSQEAAEEALAGMLGR